MSARSRPDRRPFPVRSRRLLPALCLALLLSACGGGGDELTGDVVVPEGYETFRGSGASFAYPRGWKVDETSGPDGAPTVQITPPRAAPSPTGLIYFSVSPEAGGRFDSLAEQRRLVITSVNDGEIESDEPVELAGAEKALRVQSRTPPGRGTDPVEVRSASLDVLREGGDVLGLVVAAPQRKGEEALDPEAVVSSFRLTGS